MPLLFHPHTSTALFHSITTGLELMVITFALMVKDRTSIASTAASRYPPGMSRPSTLVCASWGRHLPYSGLFLWEKLFTIFAICQQLTIIFSHKNPSEHADTLNRYDLFSASYHIVPGKRPWALTKIGVGWLHGRGAWIVQLSLCKRWPQIQSEEPYCQWPTSCAFLRPAWQWRKMYRARKWVDP